MQGHQDRPVGYARFAELPCQQFGCTVGQFRTFIDQMLGNAFVQDAPVAFDHALIARILNHDVAEPVR